MAVNIHQLIAAILPDVYCDKSVRSEVKKIASIEGYLKAAEKAKPVETEFIDLEKEMFVGNPFKLTGLKNPTEKHLLVIEDISKGLEPIYFWMLDYINEE